MSDPKAAKLPNKLISNSQVSLNKRLQLEIEELLNDVNDFLWQYHGKPVWVLNKLRFCPHTLSRDDLELIKSISERVPNIEHLIRCRQMISVVKPVDVDNANRLINLDRAIEHIKRAKQFLSELITRVAQRLQHNLSPVLTGVDTIAKVKYARLPSGGSGGVNRPKSATIVLEDGQQKGIAKGSSPKSLLNISTPNRVESLGGGCCGIGGKGGGQNISKDGGNS